MPPTTLVTVAAGDHLTQDFIIDPGYITGHAILTGANTDISSGYISAYAPNSGYMNASIKGGTGEYKFVASPGAAWQYSWFYLEFDYPSDPDPSLRSNIQEYEYLGPYTVGSGETLSGVDLTYGTATVRLYYYVEGGGELSSPEFQATRMGVSYPTVRAYGSPNVTTEGQAIGTFFPGTWTIEAFAYVEGSRTEFGTFTITVAEGDSVVIGGLGRPTIQVTNPTEGEVISADSVTVEGTATDAEGIASITINGEAVTFTSTGNPDDPNEVGFSHEVSLDVGENTITVVATDIDPTQHSVTLTLTVTREEVTTPTTLTYTGDTSVQVNTAATLSAMLVDADDQPISDAEISFEVDGQSYTAITGTDGVASCEVTLSAIGIYDVTVEFAGDATHQGSTATASLAVYTPTTLTYTGDTLVQVNGIATLEAVLVDENGQPISGAEISFQVGSQSYTAITGTDGVASCEMTAPPTADVYEIIAQYAGDATHQGSTATAFVAVYNPEGGFVTGGGWIVSPQGAYTANPTLTGRANFGFVSKYLKGATTPTGQTEFQFKVADLNFHSESYEWLVVAGAKAQYKGTGTINGVGSYRFMLTAIDGNLLAGGKGSDKFRMRIWDDNGLIYDNQLNAPDSDDPTTVISGGSIVIHK